MATFFYTAKDGPQRTVDGTVAADTPAGAVRAVLKKGLTPLDVREKRDAEFSGLVLHRLSGKKVPDRDITFAIRMLADLLGAGVPLLESLETALRQVRHPLLRDLLGDIASNVRDGLMLSEAMARHPACFPLLNVNMIRCGEISGDLVSAADELAVWREKDQEAVSQMVTSLMYPGLIVATAGISFIVLFGFVVPELSVVFEDWGTELPLVTRFVTGAARTVSRFWWIGASLVVSAVTALPWLSRDPAGQLRMDRAALRVPFLGEFIRTAETGRLARGLAALIHGGVEIVAALQAVEGVVRNIAIRDGIREVRRDVSDGAGLAQALRKTGLLDPVAAGMIMVGEQSGRPGRGLVKLAEYSELRTQRTVKRLLSLIEPGMVLILGAVIGFVFVAMLLPIMTMDVQGM